METVQPIITHYVYDRNSTTDNHAPFEHKNTIPTWKIVEYNTPSDPI